mmetsp:Transcript_107631/g.213870  ORF Transcript_107631/g.213870 Transcript_107631/m.213870 type:complete len:538 (+) Transcript_107631:46-1659(+)|eukprot:CAMPEP_0172719120 /NCGR_PEP_ID=MMETSP1074-20121228/75321_1 /TAXON_ID=2916 /ORGANISM="Ceratium fusus, Strain PA161109" /LENGTH=537 /DNA_ID=CAMNT_0013544439 /DNA_START=41 /DNA_END=1654 /DNA_ORIENTATION=+
MKRETLIKKEVAGLPQIKNNVHLKSERCKLEALKTKLEQQHHARLKSEVKLEAKKELKTGLLKLKAKLEAKKEVKTGIPKLKAETGVSDLIDRGLKLRAMAEKAQMRVKLEAKRKGVKKEKGAGKRKRNSTCKRRKGSAARRNASREVMNRPVSLSPELATLLGAPALSRPEVVSRLWTHFRDRGLINPDDKREVLFDDEMKEIFGTASSKVFEMQSLLTPHFDYTSKPAETTSASSPSLKKPKKIIHFKSDAMPAAKKLEQVNQVSSDSTHPHIHIHTAKAEALLANAKHEQAVSKPHVSKPNVACYKEEKSMEITKAEQRAIECTKTELVPNDESPGTLKSKPANTLMSSTVLKVIELKRTSARVEITLPVSCPILEVVAVPISTMDRMTPQSSSNELATNKNEVTATCSIEFREVADGSMEPYARAHVLNLQPELAYRLSVRLQGCGAGDKLPACNDAEVRLPQRAYPAKWTVHEALLWCRFLWVPEFAAKVELYAIDGATLLTLGDDDLSALGVSAPFLRRRIVAALEELRAA